MDSLDPLERCLLKEALAKALAEAEAELKNYKKSL